MQAVQTEFNLIPAPVDPVSALAEMLAEEGE